MANEDYHALLTKTPPAPNKTLPKSLILAKTFVVTLEQSMLPDDPRFPRLQLQANLPSLDFNITEYRLLELLKLLITLPLPRGEEPTVPIGGLHTISENPLVAESYALSKLAYDANTLEKNKDKKIVEFIEMVMKFTINSVKIRLTRRKTEEEVPLLDFEVKHMQLKLQSKSFSSSVDVAVGGLTLCALQNTIPDLDGPLYLLKTPMSDGGDKYLLKMHMFSVRTSFFFQTYIYLYMVTIIFYFFQILPSCPPQFAGRVKQSIKADISSLDVILHQEAIGSVISLVERVQKHMDEAANEKNTDADTVSLRSYSSTDSHRDQRRKNLRTSSTQLRKLEARRRAVAKKHKDNPKDILLQIDAKMESFTVQMSYQKKNLIKAVLSSMDFSMIQKTGKMSIILELTNLHVHNMDPFSMYKDVSGKLFYKCIEKILFCI